MSILTQPPASRETGRAMFFEHLGRYFASGFDPGVVLADPSRCSICGGAGVPMVAASGTKAPICQAQTTITRKRADRGGPDVPPGPPDTPKRGMTGLEGAAAIAGPHISWMISRIHSELPLPGHVRSDYLIPGSGQVRAMLRQITLTPPKPPFVIILFGQQASFPVEITQHPSLLRINGPDGAWVDTGRLRSLLPQLEGCKAADLRLLTDLQRQLLTDERSDRTAKLRASLAARFKGLSGLLRHLPQPQEPEHRILRQLLA